MSVESPFPQFRLPDPNAEVLATQRVLEHGARRWAPAGLLLLATAVCYANVLDGPFLFDDLTLDREVSWRDRPLFWWTIRVNRWIGGSDPFGYHLVNVVVHALAGIVLYFLARATLELARTSWSASAQRWLAFSVALLWLVHPLQTESVSYVSQRLESLAGLFTLGALGAFAASVTSARPGRWQAVALGSFVLGMATKETVAIAPLLVLLFDRAFGAGSFAGALRTRKRFYLALLAAWLACLATFVAWQLLTEASNRGATELGPLGYLATQAGVILHYLRLSFWPDVLCLDYMWPAARTSGDWLPQGIVVVALLGATIVLLVRNSWLGFAGAWFFLCLAPTSSFLPIQDAAFEHRMYLPLAAVVALVTVAPWKLWHARFPRAWPVPLACVALAASALGTRTIVRNQDYRSELAMWEGVAARAPESFRAQSQLGMSLLHAGRYAEAIDVLERSIALQPLVEDYSNLGFAYLQLGQPEKAVELLRAALVGNPEHPEALVNLGCAYLALGEPRRAIDVFEAALVVDPGRVNALLNLGAAHLEAGDLQEALRAYERALALDPGVVERVLQSTRAIAASGRSAEVGDFYQRVLAPGDLPPAVVERVRAALAELRTGSTPR